MKNYLNQSEIIITTKMAKTQEKPDFLKKISDLSFMSSDLQKKEIAEIQKEIKLNIKKWETGLYGASMANMSDKHAEFSEKIAEAKNALRILNDL